MPRTAPWATLAAMFGRLRHALAAHPRRADALLAAAFAIPSVLQALLVPFAPRPIGVVVALGTTLPIALRRSQPVAAGVLGTVFWLLPTEGYVWLGYVAAFVLFYSVAAYIPDARRAAAVTGFGALMTIVGSIEHNVAFGEFFGAISSVVAPAVVGRFVRHQREQARRLRELTHHLEVERERNAHAAVAEERGRIARELHDVVAHGISVIAIQSDAAEAALDRDPELARVPLRTIHTSATEALAEMRRLLGVLREDGDGGELAPQPGLASLDDLLARARAAGVPVTLEVEGEPRPLPSSLDLSAYRIVQEALTNVIKHAGPVRVTVAVRYADDAVTVEVDDEGPAGHDWWSVPVATGHGLVGMRERVAMYHGDLDVGPGPVGGFHVAARLPFGAPT
jgi:signal transduction histidine kinase